jgi:hypothetical protein
VIVRGAVRVAMMRSSEQSRLGSHRRKTGWIGRASVCGLGIVVGLLCATAWGTSSSRAAFEAGQRWVYRHEGPRPGSMEPNAIDGERILWVVSSVGEPGAVQWVIEERFTKDEKVVGRLFVDGAGFLNALEIQNEKGQRVRFRYDPPVPYRPVEMNVGETRTIQTTGRVDSASFVLPNKTVVERLADETVSTPAGEFGDCTHFRSTTTSTVDIRIAKIAMSEEREQWYHSSINGMVKEIYRKGPVKFLGWSRPGYTATSTLMAYGKEEVHRRDELAVQIDSEQRDRQGMSHSRGTWLRSGGLILAGIVALATGTFVLAKRSGRSSGDREPERHV